MLAKALILIVCVGFFAEYSLCFRSNFFTQNGVGFNQLTEMMREKAKFIKTPPGAIKLKYFEALVDNFNKSDTRTWKMRYFERLDFLTNDGPLYVFIGGEGKMDDMFLKFGLVYKMAQETGGAIIANEHRYYGESLPLGPLPENMPLKEYFKYLSSRQALADLAALVAYLKKQPQFVNSPVVVIGGSYSGNLAAWFRLLYPDLAAAALASSAPVQAVVDFPQYFETVTDDYRRIGSQQCVDKINKTFQLMAEDYKTVEGMDRIKKEYNICPDSNLTGFLQYPAQFYIIGMYILSIPGGNYTPISYYCSNVDGIARSVFSSLCQTISMNNYIPNQGWELSWRYQTCTEFGYFQTTDSNKQMFWGLPLEYYYEICKLTYDIEKEDVNKAVRETNEYYGGENINVTKVLFVNGQNDPWHTLGVLESSKSYIAIVVPNGYHCSDITAGNEKLAEKEIGMIKKWIGM